jgi:hypothetical protein
MMLLLIAVIVLGIYILVLANDKQRNKYNHFKHRNP